MVSVETVRNWYRDKTEQIIERYGIAEPRVHYHAGLMDEIPETTDETELKRALHQAQVKLLDVASVKWPAFRGEILDVGCGLGGGSIYWAENYRVKVTALSLVKEHLDLVNKYAFATGQGGRIQTLCSDAHEIHLQWKQLQRYDAVVAIDSSCHLNPFSWFNCLRQVLKPDGKVYICDVFAGPHADPALIEYVNRYFACKMVQIGSYLSIGNRSINILDCSSGAANFFGTTCKLIEMPKKSGTSRSAAMHRMLQYAFETRRLQYLMLEIDPWGSIG